MSTAQPMDRGDTDRKVVARGSTLEAIAGSGAVVLTILALIGVAPGFLTAIAAIALGAALLSEGGAVAGRYSDLLRRVAGRSAEMGAGMTAEIVGGIAGITLGILALVGVASWTLLDIAAIGFGASLVASTWLVSALDQARPSPSGVAGSEAARQAVRATAAPHILVGLGAMTLGILALTGVISHTLTMIAFLGVGAMLLLAGSAVTSRVLRA